MKIAILGAAGFIGTNLILKLSQGSNNTIRAIDKELSYFDHLSRKRLNNVEYITSSLDPEVCFDKLIEGFDIVYHLVSTTIPSTSNNHISKELYSNVIFSSNLFDACVRNKVKKVVFISSGGTVYGKDVHCPIKENYNTDPISSYGIQKLTIEKLLYLYNYMYGLDYRIIRLSNPYGPYQRPNGMLGAVTTFTYHAMTNKEIIVYGDGSVVRDFIFIDDAVRGILNIVNGESKYKTFNLGCGYGTSIKSVLNCIESTLKCDLNISYRESRKVDVPVNYLDISRYEKQFGTLDTVSLSTGIKRTALFMKAQYRL